MYRICVSLLLALFPVVQLASAKTEFEDRIDATTLNGASAAIATTRYNRQQRPLALSGTLQTTTVDRGSIAVLEDDGSILSRINFLDLAKQSIEFSPASATLYYVLTRTGAFDDGANLQRVVTLNDDDSTEVQLPFPFVFYGITYNFVFLNSDGNLTFTGPDNASTDRNLSRMASGLPRISPLFDDLNPERSGRISVESLPDRVIFMWTGVGEWSGGSGSIGSNTFQVVLSSNGTIRFNYGPLDATNAVVGIGPGKAAAAATTLVDLTGFISPTPQSGLIAEVFSTHQNLDLAQAAQVFYSTHPDSYDGLIVFSDFSLFLDGGAFAYAIPIRNSIRGIINRDLQQYDYGEEFGSRERLSVLVNMGDVSRYPPDPGIPFLYTNNSLSILGQEFGHRWLALVDIGSPQLLGRGQSHWSFLHNTFGSVMEGNEIEDLGRGNFRTIGATVRYSPLDQYVMGLRAASEVPPWFVVTNPRFSSTPASNFPSYCLNLNELPSCPPFVGIQLSGARQNVTIGDVISHLGPRIPSFEEAQKDFRVAFILVTRRGQSPRQSSLQFLESFRTQWESFFGSAVDGRGTMSTGLLYYAPEISSIVPSLASTLGGSKVVIHGSGFQADTVVTFDSRDAAVVFIDANTLEVTVPARPEGAGNVSVRVLNPRDGQTRTFPSGFTYVLPPTPQVGVDINSNGSQHIQTTGTNSSPQVGYAMLDGALGTSIVRSISRGETRSEVAIPAATISTSFRVYAERMGTTSTGIALLNPSGSLATIVVLLSDRRQTTIQLASRNQSTRFIHELFADIGTNFCDTLSVTSDVPIGLVALRGSSNQLNEFIMTTIPVSSRSTAAAPAVFPQVADGGGYATELILINPAPTTINGTIEFSFTAVADRGTNTKFTYEIPVGGAWKLGTWGTPSEVQVGFATIQPAAGNAVPAATAVLKQSTKGNLNFAAGVAAVSGLTRGILFGVNDGKHRTVLSLVNRGPDLARVTLTLYSQDGTLAAPAKTLSLGVNQHQPRFLDELIPELSSSFEGTIVLESTIPIYVASLRTLTNSSGTFLMTAMPVIDLNQVSTPGTNYFPQLVDGGNYSMEYLLLSTTSIAARLQFFNSAGEALPLPLQ